ncbi:MAG: hypothetical protein R2848_10455 [Thermomicrobiales bacterium]
MTDRAQDLTELFDVLTADGKRTGVAKQRALVHRDGDWHASIHVWVYGIDQGGPYLAFQRRGRFKDTLPLKLDATVGGISAPVSRSKTPCVRFRKRLAGP